MELRWPNTKGKHDKETDTEIKWLIISKSVTIIIFVEFIDQLIDYLINCTSLSREWIFLFLLFWHFLSFSSFSPIPLLHLLY